jgi:hypothetical protein
MKVLSEEKVKVLAEKNGWSLAHAEGYVEGASFRRRGMTPSMYAQIGIDEYSLGFRAGYYERKNPGLTHSGKPETPVRVRRNAGRS